MSPPCDRSIAGAAREGIRAARARLVRTHTSRLWKRGGLEPSAEIPEVAWELGMPKGPRMVAAVDTILKNWNPVANLFERIAIISHATEDSAKSKGAKGEKGVLKQVTVLKGGKNHFVAPHDKRWQRLYGLCARILRPFTCAQRLLFAQLSSVTVPKTRAQRDALPV